jgi:CMP-N-acetylneuraminic acid synthetase
LTGTKDTPFLWKKENGKWIYPVDNHDCCDRKMRQEFKEDEFTYHDNGNLYITESRILLDRECRIGYNPCVFETKGINGLQIDEEFDFELIETMAKAKKLGSLI